MCTCRQYFNFSEMSSAKVKSKRFRQWAETYREPEPEIAVIGNSPLSRYFVMLIHIICSSLYLKPRGRFFAVVSATMIPAHQARDVASC